MSDLITSQMLSDWRANYGLDKRTPIKAMHWWQDNMDGKAPAGVVAALGLCINEIERLTAERDALRDDNTKLNGWMEEEAQAAGRLQRKLNAAEEEIERLRQWEMCGLEWQNKTDWVQQRMNSGDWPVTALGKHRADVMREEIERLTAALRAQPGPVSMDDVEWAGKAHLAEAIRERDELRDVLLRNGFVPCDIPACNCGSWHHRYGLPERMQEIKDALAEAGQELSNANGHLPINALKALVAERDELRRQLAEAEQDARRYRWLRGEHKRVDPICAVIWKRNGDRNGSEWVNTANIDAEIDAAMGASNE